MSVEALISPDGALPPCKPEKLSKLSCVSLAVVGHLVRRALDAVEDNEKVTLRDITDKAFSKRLSNLESLESGQHNKIGTVISRATLWHGTGRYQYRERERIVDVLEGIAQDGGIQTNYDSYDTEIGSMQSISLAPARMYARAYADMHLNKGEDERSERHGSAIFWASIFLGDSALVFAQRQGGYLKGRSQMKVAGIDGWHAKISSKHRGLRANFMQGSDIPGNYPILFGIESAVPTTLSEAFALHEVRTREPISLANQITHVEVPRRQVNQTEDKLGEHGWENTPIIPIEDVERYASTYTFSELIRGFSVRSA